VTRDDYLRRILPLGFCSASTLALGNIAYLYLDVGLLQMLKSCCPVFVMIVAIAFQLERFSLPLVASICFIAAGTATTAASGEHTTRGASVRVSLCCAARSISLYLRAIALQSLQVSRRHCALPT
jgi:drug/metabolite transporter (DMT)-like permease